MKKAKLSLETAKMYQEGGAGKQFELATPVVPDFPEKWCIQGDRAPNMWTDMPTTHWILDIIDNPKDLIRGAYFNTDFYYAFTGKSWDKSSYNKCSKPAEFTIVTKEQVIAHFNNQSSNQKTNEKSRSIDARGLSSRGCAISSKTRSITASSRLVGDAKRARIQRTRIGECQISSSIISA